MCWFSSWTRFRSHNSRTFDRFAWFRSTNGEYCYGIDATTWSEIPFPVMFFFQHFIWISVIQKFFFSCIPKSVEKQDDGKLLVKWIKTDDPSQEFSETFDTVLFAIGRRALTRELNLDKAGVKTAGEGEKIDAVNEQTNISHIYAVGDVLYVSLLMKKSIYTLHFCCIIYHFLSWRLFLCSRFHFLCAKRNWRIQKSKQNSIWHFEI